MDFDISSFHPRGKSKTSPNEEGDTNSRGLLKGEDPGEAVFLTAAPFEIVAATCRRQENVAGYSEM